MSKTLYICGDSTAATYGPEQAPMVGWGQLLGDLLPGIRVENRAAAGRSTKSFLAEGRLQRIETEIRPGDLLLIQFTHNDMSDLVWRHTDPWTSFKNNLEIFIDTALQNGARPVLATPVCRRLFENGVLQDSHGDYPRVIRQLAAQRNLPLVDLHEESRQYLARLGEEKSRELYMNLLPGEYPAYPEGLPDNTHFRRAGAEAWARIAADKLKELGLV